MNKKTRTQLNSRNTLHANLPIPLTSFIGRERELAEVTDLLTGARLLTLIGAGGCGKTRLALQLAKDTEDAFPDGVWAVELAPLKDPALLPQSVALALGVQEAQRQPLTESLSNYLKRKHLLLVLDNCEHLRTAIAQLAQTLLLAAPNLKILATSREALSLAGETTYLVPSLSLPTPPDPSSTQIDSTSSSELALYDAPTLFIERAKVVSSNFSVTQQNAAAIVRVCERLDGVPLAIELAAARARVLTVEQIAARLDDRFTLLTSANPTTVIPRHQTLRAAIDWSYDFLSAQEQKLFRRLSVFAGGFTIEAAEAICSDKDSAHHQIFDVITELVDKSMLVADSAGRVETRYRLLETMREYAREKLMASSELDETCQRHLNYFVRFAEEAGPRLLSTEQLTWLKRLEAEHDNLRAALQWSLAKENSDAALRLAGSVFWFWYLRAHWSEGLGWLEQALALDEREQKRRRAKAAEGYTASPAQVAHRAKAICGAGLLQWEASVKPDAGRARLEEGLRLWRTLDDKWWLAVTLAISCAGLVSMTEGGIVTARDRLQEGVAIAQEVDDKFPLASCLYALGMTLIWVELGAGRTQFDAGRALLEEGVALARAVGERSTLSSALLNLALVIHFQGEDKAALTLAEEALAAAREIGSKIEMGLTMYTAGAITLALGNPVEAAASFAETLTLGRETGTTMLIALGVAGTGGLAGTIGSAQQATRLLGAAAAISRSVGMSLNLTVWGAMSGPVYDSFIQIARAQLDEAGFETALQEGQALTLEQAIEEAQSVAAQVQKKTDSAASEIEPRADLTIIAFGASQVYRGEQLLTSADWTYAKSRELLFYLLSNDSKTKEQIGLDFWPDISPAQLRNALGVRLHHLRRALGRAAWILFENNSYTFNRSLNYWFDVEMFETNIANARRVRDNSPKEAIGHFQKAVKLYRGDFLQDWMEGEWFMSRRAELREKYLDALITLGGLLTAETNYAQAAVAYKQVIEQDKYVEAAHRELMRCYARLGEPGQALRHYQELVESMQDEWGSPPALETAALFERLRRGEEV